MHVLHFYMNILAYKLALGRETWGGGEGEELKLEHAVKLVRKPMLVLP